VDYVVTVVFDVLAKHLLRVVMVSFRRCHRGDAQDQQAKNRDDGGEKALHAIHLHG
jgi:hypothetical protein